MQTRDIILLSVLSAIICALIVACAVIFACVVRSTPREERRSLRDWWKRHKPTKRRLIQVYAALLTNANLAGFARGDIYKGGTKYLCTPGLNCYACPGATGACPLGALQNALAQSGTRAPYYVFGILILFGALLARSICGFLCPVGLGQELLYKIKTPKLQKSRITRVLSYFKYVLLAVFVVSIPLLFSLEGTAVPGFCKYICPAGTLGGGIGLLFHPNQAETFATVGGLFTWKFAVLVVVVVASVFIYRFFCRFLCPLGALYGFFNRIALLGVKLDKNKCTDCGLCLSHCKMDIKRVGDHECIQCGECISVCPAKAISWKGSKLFLHVNAVSPLPAPSEEKPLSALLSRAECAETLPAEAAPEPIPCAPAPETACAVPETACPAPEAAAPKKRGALAFFKGRKRTFWLEFTAWTLALLLLVGALVYYNAIYTPQAAETPARVYTLTVDRQDDSVDTLSFVIEKQGAEEPTAAAPVSGRGTVGSPYVLSRLEGEYTVDVSQGAVFYSFSLEETAAYTVRSNDEALFLELFYERQEETITAVQLIGSGSEDFTLELVGSDVGAIMPDFTLLLYSNKGDFTLSAYRGKIVLINFWGTWCGPCVMEVPDFQRIKQKYGDAVEVLAVHSAYQPDDVQEYIDTKTDRYDEGVLWKDYGILFAQDRGSGYLGEIYSMCGFTGGYPGTLIVDADGVVAYRRANSVTFEMLDEEVRKLLAE